MGLLNFFWRNPTQDWPDHERTSLTIDLRALTFNGIPFGGSAHDLQALGRPDAEKLRKKGHYVYPASGLAVEIKGGTFWWIVCDLADALDDGLSPASVTIATERGSYPLRPNMTVEELTQLFGEPEGTETDPLGMDLYYSGKGYQLEFECSTEGQLRSVSVRGDS